MLMALIIRKVFIYNALQVFSFRFLIETHVLNDWWSLSYILWLYSVWISRIYTYWKFPWFFVILIERFSLGQVKFSLFNVLMWVTSYCTKTYRLNLVDLGKRWRKQPIVLFTKFDWNINSLWKSIFVFRFLFFVAQVW